MSDDDPACGTCRKTGTFTRPVSVVLIFAPGLAKPYPLIPAEDYQICGECDAIFHFVSKAVAAHPSTREAGDWTRAILVFTDGHGCDVKPKRRSDLVGLA